MATDIRALIDQAVRAALQPIPVQAVEVVPGYNHADEEALFVTVTLPPSTPLVGGTKYSAAITSASNALRDIGDRRFPYIRLSHAGEEAAEESDPLRAPAA